MANATASDFTSGRVPTQLASFAWPLILANFLQTIHGVTDVFLAGRLIGKSAMSAVTIGGQSTLFLITFSLGLSAGGQILIAQLKGAGQAEEQGRAMGTLFTLSLLVGLITALLGFFAAHPVLRLLQTPEEVFADALQYMRITALGLPFVFLVNAVNGALRGLGKSRPPLLFAAVAAGLHAGLGFLFVGVWTMGLWGAALSAVAAQGIAALLGVCVLFAGHRGLPFRFRLRTFFPTPKKLLQVLKIGFPFGVQMGLLNLSNLFIIRLVSPHGIAAAAALGTGSRVTNLLTVPMMAIGNGASTMVGQNLGADKQTRAVSAIRWALTYTLAFVSVTTAVTLLFPLPLLRLFTDDGEVIAIGVQYITILTWGYFGHALHSSFNAGILGAGMTFHSLAATGLEALIGRVALTWLFSIFWTLPGIFTAQAIAPYLAAALSAVFYLSGRWKQHKLLK